MSRDDRDHVGSDQVGQYRAGPDRGKLVDVPHHNHAGFGGDGPQELIAQDDIDHRRFVEYEQITVERMLTGPSGIFPWPDRTPSSRWRVLAVRSVVSARRLAARPVGAVSTHFMSLAAKISRMLRTKCGFPHAWPARNDQQFVLTRLTNGLLLARR